MKIEKMNKKDADTLSYYLAEQLYGWDGNVAELYFLEKMKDKDNMCRVVRKGGKAIAGIVARVEPYWDDKRIWVEMIITKEGDEKVGVELIKKLLELKKDKVKYFCLLIDSRARKLMEVLGQIDLKQFMLVTIGNETGNLVYDFGIK